jgi:probable rRNA maturation factor
MITMEPPHPECDARFALSKPGLSRFLERARAAAGLSGVVDVLLADDATLRRLNRQYRGKNKATDVLSFPALEGPAGEVMGGDLAISLETAARQAAEQGHSLRDEVRILMLHGVLHLAGYDHETDAGEMAAHEAELRRTLRLPTGLIARSQADVSSATRRAKKAVPAKKRAGQRGPQ